MIAFLEGTLAGKTMDKAFVNVNGVGFALYMSQNALAKLPQVGDFLAVYTHMQVSDSDISLYGFLSLQEQSIFSDLIGISGIGPKIALAALSTFSPDDFKRAVNAQDVTAVSAIPGVGKKSASRILLELKDKYSNLALDDIQASNTPDSATANSVSVALSSMGFSPDEVAYALTDADPGLSESGLLQFALKRLGSK